MYSIGIDSGSTATKSILLKNNSILDSYIVPTGWSPKDSSSESLNYLLSKHSLSRDNVFLVATGYGRVSIDFADKTVTEITCHGKGAYFLNSDIRTIIDIGGQDSKAIKIDNSGNIEDFIMNDKCAAGTGRFLQVMVNHLGFNLSDIDTLAVNRLPVKINNMCTVFAETEVVSMLSTGKHSKENITAGILYSIASKVATLASRVSPEEKIMFSGGLAQSKELTKIISSLLGMEILTHKYSQLNGAIGAATIAEHFVNKTKNKHI